MKQFSTFLQAIKYQSHCVLCKGLMSISNRDQALDYKHRFWGEKELVSFYLAANTDDIITIDPDTEEIELFISNSDIKGVTGLYTPRFSSKKNYTIKDGTFIHGLEIACRSCCQFSYTLQIWINLNLKKLGAIFLNSESLTLEDNKTVHEIKNLYSIDRTEYTYFPNDGKSKKITFPLISLNLLNPRETLSRLKKLLIFS